MLTLVLLCLLQVRTQLTCAVHLMEQRWFPFKARNDLIVDSSGFLLAIQTPQSHS